MPINKPTTPKQRRGRGLLVSIEPWGRGRITIFKETYRLLCEIFGGPVEAVRITFDEKRPTWFWMRPVETNTEDSYRVYVRRAATYCCHLPVGLKRFLQIEGEKRKVPGMVVRDRGRLRVMIPDLKGEKS
jgi:hypothetical protein